MSYRLLILVSWLMLLACFRPAEASDFYRFDTWTTDDGLPQNSVYSILQARDGYIWMTTLDGLVRYNGAEFRVFNRANTAGITSNRFRCMYEDRDGTLWLGTEDGGLIRYRDGAFTAYTTEHGLPHNTVIRVRRTADGELLAMAESGLARLQGERFEVVSRNVNSFECEMGHTGPSGATWYRVGAELRRVRDGLLTTYTVPGGGRPAHLSNQIYEDRQGRLWIGTGAKGELAMLKDEVLTIYTAKDGLPAAPVMTFCEDREGALWFGTLGGGLVHFKDGRFTTYTTRDGLSSNRIESIIEDREGTIWVGTFDNGVTRATRRVITTYSEKDGMRGRIFYPIIEDSRGDIWIGHEGVNRLRGDKFTYYPLNRLREGKFAYYPLNITPQHIRTRQPFALIQAFYEDREGRLWIGHNYGLFTFKDEKFTYEDQKLRKGLPHAIYQDSQGYLWIGYHQALIRYKDGEEKHFGGKDGLRGLVQPILEDSQGRIWVGSYGGLAQVIDDRLVIYTERDGLSSNQVRSIYEDSDGVLWIGTYDGGLNRFKDGRFTRYTMKDGMFSNGVFAILEDGRGNFWMSSNQGIYRVSRQQLNDFAEGKISRIDSISYGKADGMLNTECNGARHPSALRSRDGRLWFPTFEGVAVVDPEAVRFNPFPPPVVIERVVLDRKEVDLRGPIEIEPGQSNLDIHYAGLSFVKPEHVRFKYKLEGLDEDWIEAGNRRVAYYSHPPSGNYTFRVIAANKDGVWNLEGASISVRVLPPFWRTWWFMLMVGACVAGAAALVYRARVEKLKRAHASQQEFSRRLIDSQESDRKRIGAELHDSLGQSLIVIKNTALMILNQQHDKEAIRRQVDEISMEASRALGEVKEISYNLRPYHLDRLGLTRAIESLVDKVSKSCDIQFFTDIDTIDGLFTKEEEISLYRIVQESLNNLVKHSAASRASLTIRRNEGEIELTVIDNGKGFDQNATRSMDSRQSGFGLIGIAERVRMLGGRHLIRSEPGKGTTVQIIIELRSRKDE
ncbi:MAG: two-component regulator propeller domain-containing protein [Acidobacteriota bacterium]